MRKITKYEQALAAWIFSSADYRMNDDNSIEWTDFYSRIRYRVYTDNQVFRFDDIAQQWLYVD